LIHSKLVLKLLENGALRAGSRFEADLRLPSLSGRNSSICTETLVLARVCRRPDGTIFMEGARNGERHRVELANVVGIDGMTLERFAATCHLTENGEDIPQPTRRGRKRKIRVDQASAGSLPSSIAPDQSA